MWCKVSTVFYHSKIGTTPFRVVFSDLGDSGLGSAETAAVSSTEVQKAFHFHRQLQLNSTPLLPPLRSKAGFSPTSHFSITTQQRNPTACYHDGSFQGPESLQARSYLQVERAPFRRPQLSRLRPRRRRSGQGADPSPQGRRDGPLPNSAAPDPRASRRGRLGAHLFVATPRTLLFDSQTQGVYRPHHAQVRVTRVQRRHFVQLCTVRRQISLAPWEDVCPSLCLTRRISRSLSVSLFGCAPSHRYFDQSKLTSFQRQLNLYGFVRLTRGVDATAYYHECFLRGKEFLAKRMLRTRIKGTRIKGASSPEQEPDFYTMVSC
jgi:hypothetical protein